MNDPQSRKNPASGPPGLLRLLLKGLARLLSLIFGRDRKRKLSGRRSRKELEEGEGAVSDGGGKPASASAKNDRRSAGKSSASQRGSGVHEAPAFEVGKTWRDASRRRKDEREEATLRDGEADRQNAGDRKKNKDKQAAEAWVLAHDWGGDRVVDAVSEQDVYETEVRSELFADAQGWDASPDGMPQGVSADISPDPMAENPQASAEALPEVASELPPASADVSAEALPEVASELPPASADVSTEALPEVASELPPASADVSTEALPEVASELPPASADVSAEALPEVASELPPASADVSTEALPEVAPEFSPASSVLEVADRLTFQDRNVSAISEIMKQSGPRSDFLEVMTVVKEIKRRNEDNMKYDCFAEPETRAPGGERGLRTV